MPRPQIHIPDTPSDPFPIFVDSEIICGFGRGSSELQIPTANIPINAELDKLNPGVYFGWCKTNTREHGPITQMRHDNQPVYFNYGRELSDQEKEVFPMVMSIGWNPFYNNETKAAEVHIMHKFKENFYGASLKFVVLGYVRPELNYTTKGMLRYLEFCQSREKS